MNSLGFTFSDLIAGYVTGFDNDKRSFGVRTSDDREFQINLTASTYAQVVRNLGETAEMGYDNPLHLYLLAGPDYSEAIIRETNPELWPKAQRWECKHVEDHGFRTMAELMTALNPLTGELYREGLEFTRLSREQFALLAGKYPHPQTVVPGGVSSTVTLQTISEFHSRLSRIFDYAQKMMAIWDEIPEFFYDADARYKEVGARPVNLIDSGIWHHPNSYHATYARCYEWAQRRWSTPGVIIDGRLVTTEMTKLNMGFEEFVEHSFYEDWAGDRFDSDPLGNPMSPFHPWNKRTIPKPVEKSWKDKYTWACTPRWDRQVVEAGAYARLFITAMARLMPENDFIEATGDGLRLFVPKGRTPEAEVDWQIPEVWNTFERNRARAYHYLFSQLVALANVLEAYRLLKKGETRVAALDAADMEAAAKGPPAIHRFPRAMGERVQELARVIAERAVRPGAVVGEGVEGELGALRDAFQGGQGVRGVGDSVEREPADAVGEAFGVGGQHARPVGQKAGRHDPADVPPEAMDLLALTQVPENAPTFGVARVEQAAVGREGGGGDFGGMAGEGVQALAGFGVPQRRVALRERPAHRVLAGEPDRDAVLQ
jgi:Ni,Fe-hydrogenase I large subunit